MTTTVLGTAKQIPVPSGVTVPLRNISIYTAVCAFVGFGLFPLYIIITTALKSENDIFAWPPVWIFQPTFQSFYNALFVFGGQGVGGYILNSVIVTLASTVLAVTLGSMAAYGLARFRFRGNQDIAFYILSTRFAPPIGFIVPIYLMAQWFDLFDTRLALVIVYAGANLSFVTWIMRGFFKEVPVEVEEAALVDGYTRWQIFTRVALPLVRPGLAATTILSAIFSWNEFLFASILTPSEAATVPVYLSGFSGSMGLAWGEYMAVATIAIAPIMIFTLVLQKHLVRGLTFGAVR
jgi:multiple sugar transport system permease protein